MPGPWFSYGQPNSYGQSNSYGAPNSYGRAAAADAVAVSGDPMLVAGLATTREALLSRLGLDQRAKLALDASRRWTPAPDGLPALGQDDLLDAQGAEVRAALVQFEVLGSLSFTAPASEAEWAVLQAGGQVIVRGKRPSRARLEAELDRIQAQAPLRESRAAEILTQIAPPHAYFGAVLGLQAGRHARTLELVQATLAVAYAVGQRFKLALAVPRPTEFSGQIQPMIEVPQHGAFPAGHALEAHVTARVLSELCRASDQQRILLRALADRVAENRIVAGVHYPVDCCFGRLIGDCLASYLLSGCGVVEKGYKAWRGGSFEGDKAAIDFDPAPASFKDDQGGAPTADTPLLLPLYQRLWTRALQEWPAPAAAA
jgi:hypothetical protein